MIESLFGLNLFNIIHLFYYIDFCVQLLDILIFSSSVITSLPRLQSEHNLILLTSHSFSLTHIPHQPIRFEKLWLSQKELFELFEFW
jgi:hypothetical protein